MAPLMPQYVQIMESFVEKYLKILPDHLRNDGIRIAHNYFPGFFNRYAEYLREGSPCPSGERLCMRCHHFPEITVSDVSMGKDKN